MDRYQFEVNKKTPKIVAHIDGKILLVKRCSLFEIYMNPMFDLDKNIEFCYTFNQKFAAMYYEKRR